MSIVTIYLPNEEKFELMQMLESKGFEVSTYVLKADPSLPGIIEAAITSACTSPILIAIVKGHYAAKSNRKITIEKDGCKISTQGISGDDAVKVFKDISSITIDKT